ncbi:conserved hypothetical protein [Clostridium neonatale]|uniref:hypothetical protein n=1 Tax=Clostridium neonatale TaxID=137838 RepID=UPI00291BC5CD|nr:hypothetical protein [Clostridium neonatale]CAI3244167.1 conserved hypothetical protein [Clostridium neonatale]CAI3539672.1 conserved hypothetical protein [Clostridium neonatale]
MTFTEYLKTEEGFISKIQYDSFLEILPQEGRRKVNMYYIEKYKYYISNLQEYEQLNFL